MGASTIFLFNNEYKENKKQEMCWRIVNECERDTIKGLECDFEMVRWCIKSS